MCPEAVQISPAFPVHTPVTPWTCYCVVEGELGIYEQHWGIVSEDPRIAWGLNEGLTTFWVRAELLGPCTMWGGGQRRNQDMIS